MKIAPMLALLLVLQVLPGQQATDSTVAGGAGETATAAFILPGDTLHVRAAEPPRLRWDVPRLAGVGLVVAGGLAAWYCHNRADEEYAAYRTSGNIDEMNRLYDNARRYDQLAGLSFVGIEAGMVILYISFSRD